MFVQELSRSISSDPSTTILQSTKHLEMFTDDKFWPGEGGVVVLDDVGVLVPDEDVETLVHASVEARDALDVEGVRGFVYHRTILNRLRGNWKNWHYYSLLFITG